MVRIMIIVMAAKIKQPQHTLLADPIQDQLTLDFFFYHPMCRWM